MVQEAALLIATRNDGKFNEFKELFSDLPFKLLSLGGQEGGLDVPEDGSTYEAHAQSKALAGTQKFQVPCLGEDSGLEVEALDSRPGVYSARYAGPNATDRANNLKVLRELGRKRLPLPKRRAKFVSALCLALPDGRVFSSIGAVTGLITLRGRGKNGFGYDPIFYLPEFKRTFAEITLAEKNRLSHRAKAFDGLRKYLKKLL
ncbi:MAG: RdgB/HAM1 family non-canonical purine NTP pyrophosphatase [Nitrospirae bacterium]|nr:RdgB/HAM1 family non-canonical purine NTP pyrophosphatase [Nitrospirota bacterium]